MLTREQVYTMLMLHNRGDSVFSALPDELICYISDVGEGSDNVFNKALRLAADGREEALKELTAMLDEKPQLLLQAGNVVTRSGLLVTCTTILEFFITALDPDGVERVAPYFSKLEGGEAQKEKQFARYRAHIDALVKQIEAKQPAYDLRPLFAIIKSSAAADITEALDINNPDREVTRNTPLRAALAKFRRAVDPKRKAVGMQYEHYTTLMQSFDLLYDEWRELSDNYTNYAKCNLVWKQIIGPLQRGLPHVGRFGFARAFQDEERTLSYIHGSDNSFPDTSIDDGDLSGLGFDFAIFGSHGGCGRGARGVLGFFQTSCRATASNLQNLCSHAKLKRPSV